MKISETLRFVKVKIFIALAVGFTSIAFINCSKFQVTDTLASSVAQSVPDPTNIPASPPPFVQAKHVRFPTLQANSGHVLKNVNVVPVYYSMDTNKASLQDFLQRYISTTGVALSEVAEYGTQSITLSPAIVIQSPPPNPLTEDLMKVDALPLLPALTSDTLLVFIGPPGIPSLFSAAHNFWNVNSTNVAFAMIPANTKIDNMTWDLSHEIVEGITDPDITSYMNLDFPYFYAHMGFEVADLCDDSDEPNFGAVLPSLVYRITPSWSNLAAQRGDDPCQPRDPRKTEPYFNVMPDYDTSDAEPQDTYPSGQKLIRISPGSTKTIPLILFSTAPTSGPWTVDIVSDGNRGQNFNYLDVSLDKSQGINGDVIQMTVKVLNAPVGTIEFFTLRSMLNGITKYWEVAIGN